MQFLYFLENLRLPFFDLIFSLITRLGEETVFLVVALLFFWCVDKRRGYYLLSVGLIGSAINQALKLMFRIDRPWVLDPAFKPVEGSVEAATGYSFPSGHTQNIAGTFGSIAVTSKRRPVRILSAVLIALVAFSRMYLGVHTPLDVGVSLCVAAVLVLALYPFFSSDERLDRAMPYLSAICILIASALVLYVFRLSPSDFTGEGELGNLLSGRKNAATLLGCIVGLPLIYYVDKRFIRFENRASWYCQAIKLVGGFALVLAIKLGLSAPLVSLFGNEYVARAVRYFLIVIFAGLAWPVSFKYIARIKCKPLDAFGERVASLFHRGKKEAKNENEA